MKKSKIYIRMLLSYIGILMLPIMLGFMLYVVTLDVMKDQSAKMNENMLEMVQREIDQKVAEINRIASRFAMDNKVQKASREKDKFENHDQIMLYDIFKDLRNLSVSENFISDVFIYFKNTETVSSVQGTMSADLYYHLNYESADYTIDQFKEYLGQVHYADNTTIFKKNGENILMFTMSDLGVDIREASATVCITVKYSEIEKILNSMAWNDQMGIFLVNENDEIIGKSRIDAELNAEYDDSIITIRQSDVNEWKYVTVVPVSVLEKDIQDVRKMAVMGLFLCLLAGFFISYYLTKKNYNPIRSIMELFKKYSDDEIKAGENEYQWLNEQVNQFFKSQIDAKRLLRHNQKNLKAYYLSQLLQYSYDGSIDHLKQYGINLEGTCNRVIRFQFKGTGQSQKSYEASAQENALRKFILMNILEETILNYFQVELVEMGEDVIAIINSTADEPEHTILLRENIEQVQQIVEERFDFGFTALVGPVHQGMTGIHVSWQQTMELESYINLLDTDLVTFEEVKDIQPQYHYSVEMEQRIINAIKMGDEKAAKEYMDQVFQENFQGKVSTSICRFLIYDLIGTLLKGANAGGYRKASKEIDFSQGFTVKQPISELKQQFFETAEVICQKIVEEQKQIAEDNSLSQRVESYIQENYWNPDLNISITSQYFKMTPAYLSSIYKKQTGSSLLDYINSVRIEHAEKLLLEGYNVMEVRKMTGFGDSSTFIRIFKKKKGITPGQLKKNMAGF